MLLLVLCEFHIIHSNPTYLFLLFYLPSTLATMPQQRKNIVEAVVCHSMSHSIPFLSTLLCLQMFIVMDCQSGTDSWLLILYLWFQYWNVTRYPLEYHLVALCHGDPDVWYL